MKSFYFRKRSPEENEVSWALIPISKKSLKFDSLKLNFENSMSFKICYVFIWFSLCRITVFGFFVDSHIPFCLRRFFKCSYQFECVRIVWWLIEFLQNNNRKMEFACTTCSCLVRSTERKNRFNSIIVFEFQPVSFIVCWPLCRICAHTHTHSVDSHRLAWTI